eukprot:CAMPEP_0167769102 /NCGR_PEP_ID=MMETSP0110_2-20121227/17102_1 /TAXON_ID=629695 /ORGANISM="Gymnochlora sp., Strain CCMP2014" /LENGTH=1310 /DNA_ID=CAMNT_0007657981 /DNA_START=12 /DNA_END=3941 /DNA_ORIENTATION=+
MAMEANSIDGSLSAMLMADGNLVFKDAKTSDVLFLFQVGEKILGEAAGIIFSKTAPELHIVKKKKGETPYVFDLSERRLLITDDDRGIVSTNTVPGSGKGFSQDAKAILQDILSNLPLAIEAGDMVGTDFVASRGVRYYLENLEEYLFVKYPMKNADKKTVAKLLYSFIVSEKGTIDLVSFRIACVCLKKLLKKKDIKGLELPWRPLYGTVNAHISLADSKFLVNTMRASMEDLKKARKEFYQVIKKCRFYFPKSATKEILDTMLPRMEPFTEEFHKYQALLCLFLPVKHGAELIKRWLPRLFKISLWASRSSSMSIWFDLWSRVAKHNIGKVDLSPILAEVFALYTQSLNLNLNLGSGNPNKGLEKRFPPKYKWLIREQTIDIPFGRLMVYTLHLDRCKTLAATLFQMTESYFHPSNTGRHLANLSTLLATLSNYYGKRIGREMRGEGAYESKLRLEKKDSPFVKMIMPVVKMAMYSKSYRMIYAVQFLLRTLANVHPNDVVGPQMKEWIHALTNVSQSHRTMSALSCMGWSVDAILSRKLNPTGCQYLEQILWKALPGIDPVDLMKTGRTLTFYVLLFYTVPFVDARKHQPAKGSMQKVLEYDEEAKRATMCLDEWCPQFLDALLKVIKQQEGFSEKNRLDLATLHFIGRAIRAFFMCLSERLGKLSIEHLAKRLTSADFWSVQKYTGVVFSAAGLALPTAALEKLLLLFGKKLVEKSKDGKTWNKVEGTSGGETEYSLFVISELLSKAGAAIIPHLDLIRGIYACYKDAKSKDVKKNARCIIKKTLQALTSVYPAEYRGNNAEKWDDPTWNHWQDWGNFEDVNNLGIRWHVPTRAELKSAASLCELALVPALDTLSKYRMKGSSTESEDSELKEVLAHVEDITTGIHCVLGDFSDREVTDSKISTTASKPVVTSFQGFQLNLSSDGKSVRPCLAGEDVQGSISLRTHVANVLCGLTDRIIEEDASARKKRRVESKDGSATTSTASTIKGSVQIMSTLATCLGVLLNLGESEYKKTRDMFKSKTTDRMSRRDFWSSKKCTLRTLNVEYADLLHHLRIEFSQKFQRRYTAGVVRCLACLLELSVNDFEKVRSSATGKLQVALQRYPKGGQTAFIEMLDVVKSKDSSKEELLGALRILSFPEVLQCISTNIDNTKLFLEAMFMGSMESSQDDHVQAATQGLFQGLLATFRAPVPTGSKKEMEAYTTKLDDLITHFYKIFSAGGKKMHWRYKLVGTAMLLDLVLSSEFVTKDALKVFTDGLISDTFALRQLSIRAITAVLHMKSVLNPDKTSGKPWTLELEKTGLTPELKS